MVVAGYVVASGYRSDLGGLGGRGGRGGYVGQLQSILRRCLRGQWLRASVEVRVARPDSASKATIGVQGWKGQRQGTDGLDNGSHARKYGPLLLARQRFG